MSLRAQRARAQARAALNRPRLKPGDPILDAALRPDSKTATALLVIDTKVVAAPRGLGVHHYEITCAPDADAPRRLVILTRHEGLYNRALIVEGTDRRVRVAFHPSTRPDGAGCYVLDAIEELAP